MTCGERTTIAVVGVVGVVGMVGRFSMVAMRMRVDRSASEADLWDDLQRVAGLLISIC
jgi:hypothetical protein